jgi:peptidoglycan/xylan/chitin deacetylase (PgdA/CDA1 family)
MVSIDTYTGTGAAEWYPKDIPAHGGQAFSFADYYMASTSTIITVQFTSDSGKESWVDIALPTAAASWTKASGAFLVPDGTVSLTVQHLLKGAGTLTVDDYSLSPIAARFSAGMVTIAFDDGWESAYQFAFPILQNAKMPATFAIISGSVNNPNYMTSDQVTTLLSAGEEISAHTRTHARLPSLSPDAMKNEILGSRLDLQGLVGNHVSTFAYPYGAYNAPAVQIAEQSGYAAARTVERGYNFPGSNRFLLRAMTVDNTTDVPTVKSWIDTAVNNHEWLILVFHQVNADYGGSDLYTISSADFQTIVNYLADKKVAIVTTATGASKLLR